jgi:hypothetical protein
MYVEVDMRMREREGERERERENESSPCSSLALHLLLNSFLIVPVYYRVNMKPSTNWLFLPQLQHHILISLFSAAMMTFSRLGTLIKERCFRAHSFES